MIFIAILIFIGCLFFGIPIAFSLGLGTIFFLFATDTPYEVLAQQLYIASASFPLMAIPFFLLAGELMDRTGITLRLIKVLTLLVGRMHGGLGQVMILAGTILAGLSGSGAADTAALAKIMIPGMEKEGYKPEFGAALAAAVGVLGPIIPPSIAMIVYGSMMNVSVGALFVAGIMPGLLIGGFLMITTYVLARKHKIPLRAEPFSWGELFTGLKDASLAILMPVIIIWGIRGGVFTPTEGGAVACVYAIFLGCIVYRTLSVKSLLQALLSSGVTAGSIMLIVAVANPFGWLLAANHIPQMVSESIMSLTSNKFMVLLLINILLLFMGMFMETIATILLLAPILAPIAVGLGVAPLHFALIMIVNLCIGLLTPPVGLNLFVGASCARVSLEKMMPIVMPFLLVEFVALGLITYFPSVSLFIPRLMGW